MDVSRSLDSGRRNRRAFFRSCRQFRSTDGCMGERIFRNGDDRLHHGGHSLWRHGWGDDPGPERTFHHDGVADGFCQCGNSCRRCSHPRNGECDGAFDGGVVCFSIDGHSDMAVFVHYPECSQNSATFRGSFYDHLQTGVQQPSFFHSDNPLRGDDLCHRADHRRASLCGAVSDSR